LKSQRILDNTALPRFPPGTSIGSISAKDQPDRVLAAGGYKYPQVFFEKGNMKCL